LKENIWKPSWNLFFIVKCLIFCAYKILFGEENKGDFSFVHTHTHTNTVEKKPELITGIVKKKKTWVPYGEVRI
jgi:hypothetical protein